MEYFHNMFQEPASCPIMEMIKVIDLFPRAIIEEMNEELTKDITEEEIQQVLYSFEKGKSPGPDGFTLDFFLGFYDKTKDDLLAVV